MAIGAVYVEEPLSHVAAVAVDVQVGAVAPVV
jgi:hypothetical protein